MAFHAEQAIDGFEQDGFAGAVAAEQASDRALAERKLT